MSKKMSKKELMYYKKRLLEIKGNIVGEIKQFSDDASEAYSNNSGDVSGHVLHMADVATDMYDREFSLGLASNERELLYQVEAALLRIEENKFGICEECNKSIPSARLKAIPYAQTCLKCQEKIESK